MATSSVVELAVDLAWTQWVALGVSGSAPVPRHAIDLEAILAFTPLLEDVEPRLCDEALDWCIQHASGYVSLSRLRQVLKLFSPAHRERFGRFAAIVNHQARTKWPTFDAEPRPFRPSGKSQRPQRKAPSLAQLRARKIFGVNARADVLINLLQAPGVASARQLVKLGYTKRALAEVLDDLFQGGVLLAVRIGNVLTYRLQRRDLVEALLAPVPDEAPPWPERLMVASTLIAVDRQTNRKSTTIRAIELRKALEPMRQPMASVNEPLPDLPPRQDPWPIVLDWIRPLLIP
jgi:hypothetical protein